ncbi:hypothetical protein GT614_00705 [Enterobacter hormaechei]|uniref:hypothetical protein n=1 Tax=Enterobacter hormaechei TaxID=158836 RepID=UPI00136E255B|nr:hypothetical protein [Enterobacter hormaechei]MZJ51327.1 hypothetical protein [Enterobacter hormaechei]MZJ71402.1 hypothetical protein [Enterobacter hormaechei]MZK00723.1 hypothetical protein [Enterobacter hormaechei]MZK12135.1 hypothetical protein [Enterobacter hormaechei]MZK19523.1 hypothetical protein [Enterobacter hormaechei]
MSNIDKQAQKELYAKVEQQAHSLRGSPREYQALTGLCPVNVIEMHAQKIQALLDELEAAEKRIAEQSEIMRQAASDISYAIFNLTGSDLSRLKPGVVESTDPTDTALIAERSLRAAAGKGE